LLLHAYPRPLVSRNTDVPHLFQVHSRGDGFLNELDSGVVSKGVQVVFFPIGCLTTGEGPGLVISSDPHSFLIPRSLIVGWSEIQEQMIVCLLSQHTVGNVHG